MKIGMREMVCLAWVSALALGQGALAAYSPLTFDDRVRAQEAVERVYYNHRIWPKENPGPKPAFEKMISRAQIEAKVEDYLKKSAALDKFWQRPITAEQLQAEMDRMAEQTKDPDTLRELFVALDNDPYLIAECLARPILADRLIHNWYAYDTRFHAEARAKAEKALKELTPENFARYPEGTFTRVKYVMEGNESGDLRWSLHRATDEGRIVPLDGKQFLKTKDLLGRSDSILSVRETEMAFVIERHTGLDGKSVEAEARIFAKGDFGKWWILQGQVLREPMEEKINNAALYVLPMVSTIKDESSKDHWVNSSLNDVPDGRSGHTAVWTGTEMIVWGGGNESANFNTGGRYNPATDSWTNTSTEGHVPSARRGHTAIWTGLEMIIWGGGMKTGARYDPSMDTWAQTSTDNPVSLGISGQTAVWTGTEMMVWGGVTVRGEVVNSGGRYDPSSDSWKATSSGADVPSAREKHTAVWTGTEMIVWGGVADEFSSVLLNTGGRYRPATDSWLPVSIDMNAPLAREGHTAVWSGQEMIIWGGWITNGFVNTGGRYDPTTDSWICISAEGTVPSARMGHTALWSGAEMIVWGGYGDEPLEDPGSRYDPSSDSWIPISTNADLLVARDGHTAVWTEVEMIVWGGYGGSYNEIDTNAGGRYNPSTDSWVAISRGSDVPSARVWHKAVWTGLEMIIWGGFDSTGERYTPATDSWAPVSTGAEPPSGQGTAVWTGLEMIVWGGLDNKGGRYNPASDNWMATSTGSNVPTGRQEHSAVWTGTEMIVWGGCDRDTCEELQTGGRYNPGTDSWTPTSTGAHVPAAREGHAALWTGTEMIVWGGSYYDTDSQQDMKLNSGGRYNPCLDTWNAISTGINVPSPRWGFTAVWTGTEMIVWGGYHYSIPPSPANFLLTGARYNPSIDSWSPTSTRDNVPEGRIGHTAVWTGGEMIIWGGEISLAQCTYLNSGGLYNPATDSWTSTSEEANVPSGRWGHTAIWTGTEMILWGGDTEMVIPGPESGEEAILPNYFASGGIYIPESPHTRPVSPP